MGPPDINYPDQPVVWGNDAADEPRTARNRLWCSCGATECMLPATYLLTLDTTANPSALSPRGIAVADRLFLRAEVPAHLIRKLHERQPAILGFRLPKLPRRARPLVLAMSAAEARPMKVIPNAGPATPSLDHAAIGHLRLIQIIFAGDDHLLSPNQHEAK